MIKGSDCMNPFKEENQILPIASINSVYVEHELAIDLFRPKLLMDAIYDSRSLLGIEEDITSDEILYRFNDCLISENEVIRKTATTIAKEFGQRLAKVIVTLKKPSEISKVNRPEWTSVHWDYWKNIEKLYLVGGLTSPVLTSIFYQEIQQSLASKFISDFIVSFVEGSSDLGTKGLSTLVENGDCLLFDFGQTNIKRRHYVVHNEDVGIDIVLDPVKANYLFYKDKSLKELEVTSYELDSFIQQVIIDTIKEVQFKGKTILISIANYVNNGMIYSARGGYAKLSIIAHNYQEHLEKALSKEAKRELKVKLFHDTSAMALNFKNEKSTAVISLGTAFGVAFPE